MDILHGQDIRLAPAVTNSLPEGTDAGVLIAADELLELIEPLRGVQPRRRKGSGVLRLLVLLSFTGPGASGHLVLVAVLAVLDTHCGQHPGGQGAQILFPGLEIIALSVGLGELGVIVIQQRLSRADLALKGGKSEAVAQIQIGINGLYTGSAGLGLVENF